MLSPELSVPFNQAKTFGPSSKSSVLVVGSSKSEEELQNDSGKRRIYGHLNENDSIQEHWMKRANKCLGLRDMARWRKRDEVDMGA